MSQSVKIADLFDLRETIARPLFDGAIYPWELLPKIKAYILDLGATLPAEEYDHPSEDVWIA